MPARLDAVALRPVARRFLQAPNDAEAEAELCRVVRAQLAAERDVEPAIAHVLQYVRERPAVQEFLLQLLESASLASLLAKFGGHSSSSSEANASDLQASKVDWRNGSLIASYRAELRDGRILCDDCHQVIKGPRFKYDLFDYF